jgi:hypothetical protein
VCDINNILCAILCSVYKQDFRRKERNSGAGGTNKIYGTADIGNHAVSSAVGQWQGRPSGTMKQKYVYSNTNEAEQMFRCQ